MEYGAYGIHSRISIRGRFDDHIYRGAFLDKEEWEELTRAILTRRTYTVERETIKAWFCFGYKDTMAWFFRYTPPDPQRDGYNVRLNLTSRSRYLLLSWFQKTGKVRKSSS